MWFSVTEDDIRDLFSTYGTVDSA
ncbi:hypothetical protein [Candidatus Entotheonella palauensis]